VVFDDDNSSFGEQRNHQSKINEYETDSGFTVITEQKATAVKDTRPLMAQVHRPRAQTVAPATKRSAKGGEIDRNEAGATVTATTLSTEGGHNATSSDQDRAAGTRIHLLITVALKMRKVMF